MNRLRKFFFGADARGNSVDRNYRVAFVRRFACFDSREAYNRCRFNEPSSLITVTAAVHRFEQSIGGRPYLIEVAPVSEDRWRAYIVRLPGVPTALMPFYGTTPADAADQLCKWLARAHARATDGARHV